MFAVGVHDNARRVGVARNVSGLVSVPPHYTTRHSSHHLTHNILRCTIQTCTHTHTLLIPALHTSRARTGHTHAEVTRMHTCLRELSQRQDDETRLTTNDVEQKCSLAQRCARLTDFQMKGDRVQFLHHPVTSPGRLYRLLYD